MSGAHLSPAAAAAAESADSVSFFFYGTLVHPAILARIVGEEAARNVYVQPALLPDHICRHVQGADYPALVPYDSSLSSSSSSIKLIEGRSFVRGVLVRGLTARHAAILDAFEGDDYTRDLLQVHYDPATPPVRNDLRPASREVDALTQILASLSDDKVAELLTASSKIEPAHVYLWTSPAESLDAQRGVWSFEAFVRDNAHKWTGRGLTEELQQGEGEGGGGVEDEAQQHAFDEYRAVDAARHQMLGDVGRTSSSALVSMPVGDDPWAAADPQSTTGASSAAAAPAGTSSSGATASASASAAPAAASASASDNPWANEEEARKDLEREAEAVRAALAIGSGGGANGAARGSSPSASKSAPALPLHLSTTAPGAASPLLRESAWGSETPLRSDTPPSDSLAALQRGRPGQEKLGRAALKFWGFAEGYTNLNNGAYGACPKPVRRANQELQEQIESAPDVYRRVTIFEHLRTARERLGKLLNAPPDCLALIANATTGTNAVLRDFPWQEGDAILALSTLYPAVARTIAWVQDHCAHAPKVITVPVTYPCTHDSVVSAVEAKIAELKSTGELHKVKLGIIDTVSSKPGVRVPWERLCRLFREHQILSLVDGAHGIGIIPLDLRAADPDFFVSNCHKWGYAPRSTALFYVPERNRHLQTSSLPTAFGYVSKVDPSKNTWLEQWEWPSESNPLPLGSVNTVADIWYLQARRTLVTSRQSTPRSTLWSASAASSASSSTTRRSRGKAAEPLRRSSAPS